MRLRFADWLQPIVIVIATATLFTLLLSSGMFADPDAFYHAKMALLIRDQGVVQSFPWLPFTELGRQYADQHFLYHVFLIPFVSFPDPLVGLKIATVVLAAGLTLTFYAVARKLNIAGAFPATLVLLFVTPFTFRLALAKGNAFALILLLLALYALFRYRPVFLGIVTFIFVWAYGGFPLVILAAVLFLVAALVGDAIERRHHVTHILLRLFPLTPDRVPRAVSHALRLLAAAVIGMVAGIVFNPFFPHNLPFLYNQFIRVGVVNYRHVIGVGGEWYPYQPLELATNTIVLTILLLLAIVAFLWTTKRQSRRSWTLLLLTAAFFVLTVKSRRYVEYYVPLGMLFSVSALSDAYRPREWQQRLRTTARRLTERWRPFVLSVLLAVYLLIMIPTVATRDLVTEWRDLRRGFRSDQYAAAMRWLERETPRDAIVVHSDWDEFPLLFYFNSRNRYIAGLDPTFLYTADRPRYQTWVDISTGQYAGSLRDGLRQLDASYVFVDRDHTAMLQRVRNDPAVEEIYADADATIFAVR